MSEGDVSKRADELLQSLDILRRRLEALEQEMRELKESEATAAPAPAPAPPPLPPQAPPKAPPKPVEPPAAKAVDKELLAAFPDAYGVKPAAPAEKPAAKQAPAEKPAAEKPSPEKPAAAPAPTMPRKPRAPRRPLEQVIGTRWMLIGGVGVLLLGAVFFFKYAIDQGWINETIRVIAGGATGLAMVGAGEWAIRRRMRGFAAGVIGGGIVLLYGVVFIASPNGLYDLLSSTVAFALMCCVTGLGIAMSLRCNLLTTAVIALVGAMLTPVLLRSGRDQQVALMTYLLFANGGFLIVAAIKRWSVLAPMALAGTIGVFVGWACFHYTPEAMLRTLAFGWALSTPFTAYAVAGKWRDRIDVIVARTIHMAAAGAMAVLVALTCDSIAHVYAFGGQMLVLAAIALAVAMRMRWRSHAPVLLWGVIVTLVSWLAVHYEPTAFAATCGIGWAMTALFTAWTMVDTRGGEPGDEMARKTQLAAWIAMGVLMTVICRTPEYLYSFGGQLLVLNAAVLAQALWKRWENGLVALAGTAGAMGVWLALHHVSSAVVATTVFGWALAALLVAYAVAVFVTKRGEPFVAGAVYLGAVAAMGALVFVTCESIAYVHAFHVQMLVLSAGVAALILWRRWPGVLPVAAVALAVTVWVWLAMHFEPSAAMATCVYIWGLLAVLAGSILTYPWEARHRWHLHTMAAVVPMVLFGWIAMWRGLPLHAAAAQSLALVTGTLLLCARFRWNWLRGELLACSTVALTLLWVNWFWSGEMGVWTLPVWIWAFYAVVLADVLARAWLRRLETNEKLDATLSALATGLMFAATCQLLRGTYVDWLGTYTAVLGVGAVALAWIVRRRADRRVLGYAFLGQGLVLLALAAPIQWDRSLVAIAWGAQGVVAMFLARRLGNRMLLLKSPVVLTLAIVRFLIDLSQGQGGLADTILSVGGTDLSHALLLATGLAAAILVAVAILRMGPPVMSGHDRDERIGGAVMVIVALTLFGGVAALELPAVAATWWWLVAAAGVAGVAVWRRSHLLAAIAAVSLSLTALKWAGFDTLICRLMFGADLGRMTVVNWQLGAGLALAAVMLLFLTKLASRGVELAKMLSGVVAVAAGLLVIWGGSFEVDRFFAGPPRVGAWGDPAKAAQMAYSIWWAVCATASLIVGFALSRASVRYLGIVVFAVTLGKVLIVDMQGVEAVYRILSFLALGVLLLGGSWLYYRHTTARDADPAEEE